MVKLGIHLKGVNREITFDLEDTDEIFVEDETGMIPIEDLAEMEQTYIATLVKEDDAKEE